MQKNEGLKVASLRLLYVQELMQIEYGNLNYHSEKLLKAFKMVQLRTMSPLLSSVIVNVMLFHSGLFTAPISPFLMFLLVRTAFTLGSAYIYQNVALSFHSLGS